MFDNILFVPLPLLFNASYIPSGVNWQLLWLLLLFLYEWCKTQVLLDFFSCMSCIIHITGLFGCWVLLSGNDVCSMGKL